MAKLNEKQINDVANKMADAFETKTGLKINRQLLISSMLSTAVYEFGGRAQFTDEEVDNKVYQDYKDLYKNVLDDIMIENKKILFNPKGRTAPSRWSGHYSQKFKEYKDGVANDRRELKEKTKNAPAEFEAFMHSIYDNFYAELLKEEKPAPEKGGLTEEEKEAIAKKGHTDPIKYYMDTHKKLKSDLSTLRSRTDERVELVNRISKKINKDATAEEISDQLSRTSLWSNDVDFISHPTAEEKIANVYAYQYFALKELHDSRNFISQLFHFKETRTLSSIRNSLRDLIPGAQRRTNDEMESLMKSVCEKRALSDYKGFEMMAVGDPDKEEVAAELEKYDEVAKAALDSNKQIDIDELFNDDYAENNPEKSEDDPEMEQSKDDVTNKKVQYIDDEDEDDKSFIGIPDNNEKEDLEEEKQQVQ